MDDGEVEPSDSSLLQNSSTCKNNDISLPGGSASVDSLFDELLKHTRTCTHTHTCNPPGPDAEHTHTCYHTHTQVFSSEDDTKTRCETSSLKARRPLGNREAVRKYREKKKAHTAYLEEEVRKLRVLNQHLVRKLQGQAALEAEVLRLRALLVDLRGKIDTETFLFQNHCSSNTDIISFKEGDYVFQPTSSKANRLQCQTQVPCFLQQENQSISMVDGQGGNKAVFSWQESCQPVILDCHGTENGMVGTSDHQLENMDTNHTIGSAKNQSQ
ncbi:basic leucine zipper 23-like [Chenopodium quinoa]|uniref:BZIP domain-containing protein n=1 Tax=Chenopodium quinoa TaxID=63459 RepID=A0A803LKS0_CHEQI|nr:basic leucine zipper 23-like [Chenopodium quinoa]